MLPQAPYRPRCSACSDNTGLHSRLSYYPLQGLGSRLVNLVNMVNFKSSLADGLEKQTRLTRLYPQAYCKTTTTRQRGITQRKIWCLRLGVAHWAIASIGSAIMA